MSPKQAPESVLEKLICRLQTQAGPDFYYHGPRLRATGSRPQVKAPGWSRFLISWPHVQGPRLRALDSRPQAGLKLSNVAPFSGSELY